MLHKSIAALVKDLDTAQGIVSVYASSFNVEDDGADVVRGGAFTKTIGEWGPQGIQPRIKWLWQHEAKQIIGKPIEMAQDDYGLLARGQAAPTTLGKDTLILYEYKVITEHSIGYEVIDSRYDRKNGTRELLALKLFEYSSVTWGMNSQTPTVGIKSLGGLDALTEHVARLDRCLHDASFHTEDIPIQLERQYKSLSALLPPTEPTQSYVIQSQHQDAQKETPMPTDERAKVKALDFATALTQVSADDTLQDDWGDSFQAVVNSMYSIMCQGVYGSLAGQDGFDAQGAAETALQQFSAHMGDLVKQSLAADFCPMLDDDGDSFYDPDGPNADDGDDDSGWMAADIHADIKQFRAGKAGRTISADNHAMMSKAADMIGEGHKAISSFLKSNAPAANDGDTPPSQSDSVYDPGFGKSHSRTPLYHYANANARAGARPPRKTATTADKAAGALAEQGHLATTPSGRDTTPPDDEIAQFRALMAEMRQGVKERAPVAG